MDGVVCVGMVIGEYCGSLPYMFLHFCKMLFLELVSGDFFGEGSFFGILATYMFFHYPAPRMREWG